MYAESTGVCTGVSVGGPAEPDVEYNESCDPSKVRVYGAAMDGQAVTFEPTQFTVNCADAGRGLLDTLQR